MVYKLKEIGDFYSGTGFPIAYQGETDGELPFYKVGDISANVAKGHFVLQECNNYISRKDAQKLKGAILPPNTVVFAKIGEALKLNRRALTAVDCLIDNNVMGVRPHKNVDAKFFFYFMQRLKMESLAESTTVPSVRKSRLEQVEIYLPNIEKQQQMVEVLDRITGIIASRKQQLSALDTLIKARFVEMFGDPESNLMQWPIKSMADICSIKSSKRVLQSEQSSSGIPFLRVSDLVKKIDMDELSADLYISEERYANLEKNGLVPITGDILVTSRGTLGKCYIWCEEDKFYFQDGMISWLSDYSELVTPRYIAYLFLMPGFKKQIEKLQAGSTVAYLSIAMIKKLCVMLPDKRVQDDFSAFVSQVDKSKAAVQKSLDEAQLLFDSLMQQYFG